MINDEHLTINRFLCDLTPPHHHASVVNLMQSLQNLHRGWTFFGVHSPAAFHKAWTQQNSHGLHSFTHPLTHSCVHFFRFIDLFSSICLVHVNSYRFVSLHLMPCHFMSSHLISFCIISCHFIFLS
jgi:hypothetical protein